MRAVSLVVTGLLSSDLGFNLLRLSFFENKTKQNKNHHCNSALKCSLSPFGKLLCAHVSPNFLLRHGRRVADSPELRGTAGVQAGGQQQPRAWHPGLRLYPGLSAQRRLRPAAGWGRVCSGTGCVGKGG